MRKLSLILGLLGLLLIPQAGRAQSNTGNIGNTQIRRYAGVPSGTCTANQVAVNNANLDFYDCDATTHMWVKVGSGGGGATPGGTGSQIQYRAGASTFGGIGGTSTNSGAFPVTFIDNGLGTGQILRFSGPADSALGVYGNIEYFDGAGSGGNFMQLNSVGNEKYPTYGLGTLLLSSDTGLGFAELTANDGVTNVDYGICMGCSDFGGDGTGSIRLGYKTGKAFAVGSNDGMTTVPHITISDAGAILLTPTAGQLLSSSTAVTSGTDNSAAGSFLAANSAANAHTVWASGATTTNTIAGFATVPTTGHLLDCTVTSTTCLLHDSGVVTSTVTKTVASGAKALATSAISSGACSTAQTDTATGTLTTDAIIADFNADPTGVTGYAPVTTGMLTIIKYPTADTVNFKICNLTSSSITPGAITLNWRVVR